VGLNDQKVEFDFWTGRYQVVGLRMGDCLATGKPSRYIINTRVNSAFHPFVVNRIPACNWLG